MIIDKIESYMNTATKDHELVNMKVDAYAEAAYNQYEINCAKARLKVMMEDGTADDLLYLQEEAANGFIDSIKKAIDKIIEALKKFCNTIKLKVLSMITSKETKEGLSAIEKKVKLNPFLSKKKVQIENTEAEEKVVHETFGKFQRLLSKLKGGKEVSVEEITDIEDEAESKLKQKAGVGAAITITVSAAVALLKKRVSNIGEDIDKMEKISKSILEEAKDAGGDIQADMASTLQKLSSAVASIGKKGASIVVDGVTTVLTALKSVVSKVSGNTADTVAESGENDDEFLESMASDLIKNSTDSNDSLLEEMENELFGESSSNDEVLEENSKDGCDFDFDAWLNESSDDIDFEDFK